MIGFNRNHHESTRRAVRSAATGEKIGYVAHAPGYKHVLQNLNGRPMMFVKQWKLGHGFYTDSGAHGGGWPPDTRNQDFEGW